MKKNISYEIGKLLKRLKENHISLIQVEASKKLNSIIQKLFYIMYLVMNSAKYRRHRQPNLLFLFVSVSNFAHILIM